MMIRFYDGLKLFNETLHAQVIVGRRLTSLLASITSIVTYCSVGGVGKSLGPCGHP
jgi:hypothetical protein